MNLQTLLETYELEEILEQLGIEPVELLELLRDQLGYDFALIVEPIE